MSLNYRTLDMLIKIIVVFQKRVGAVLVLNCKRSDKWGIYAISFEFIVSFGSIFTTGCLVHYKKSPHQPSFACT